MECFLQGGCARVFLRRKKSEEMKTVTRQWGRRQRGGKRARARHWGHFDAASPTLTDQQVTGIRYQRCACIGNERDIVASLELLQKLVQTTGFIELVQRDDSARMCADAL